MVYRLYVEKKPELASAEHALLEDIGSFLGISGLERVRILKRYDVEGIDAKTFDDCRHTVFSEPATDNCFDELENDDAYTVAVEYLPGQFDQRADSAAQCIQLVTCTERPTVRTATIYKFYGTLTLLERELIDFYIINPVECRKASLEKPEELSLKAAEPNPPETIKLSSADLDSIVAMYGLAMSSSDLRIVADHFASVGREPTISELKVIDTYWSDHCRHTTFHTRLDNIDIEDSTVKATFDRYMDIRNALGVKKPVTLMDMATIGAKYLKSKGLLDKLDESDEINACTVKIDVDSPDGIQKWLLLFKNETHNHPTEIEPFGGAATCIGGAIRDPLSGRSYVYQAMRISGASNPLEEAKDTLSGKLPQRRIARVAASGYSSYGNQIGLATGIVDELYHPGYVAKHLELGAVIAAAPEENVRREAPVNGDVVILLGGKTGRDGCGGATGSSKAHDEQSLSDCGAEVQKGNAPEERKLQRLFRQHEAARLIKRCNDFGAGGVCVAIGELAAGLDIDLDAVLKKYDGLDATELAISESQERMAVVVSASDAEKFIEFAHAENLDATIVARVTDSEHLVLNWHGMKVVDIPRSLLDTNGAERHATAKIDTANIQKADDPTSFHAKMKLAVASLNTCSKRGLVEMFDSTIGAGTVLAPFGGKTMRTPIQAMAATLPTLGFDTSTCSLMAYAFDPHMSSENPYIGAYNAVVSSVAKVIATGGSRHGCYLTLQEYFEKLGTSPQRWGKPAGALLGALEAQLSLEIAAIGGKDTMSGSFENLDVPPTLVSFAVCTADASNIISPEFKRVGSKVVLLAPKRCDSGLYDAISLRETFDTVEKLISQGKALSVFTPKAGGIAEALFLMGIGNNIGFETEALTAESMLFENCPGGFVIELYDDSDIGIILGHTVADAVIRTPTDSIALDELYAMHASVLEPVYPTTCKQEGNVEKLCFEQKSAFTLPRFKHSSPKVLIPVFPGTNCEYDSARAVSLAGGDPELLVIRNRTKDAILDSVRELTKRLNDSQVLFIPGGFSGGDEPDGSARLITSIFRNSAVSDAVSNLLEVRDGLVLGICNGFQALIKLGLLPYGRITAPKSDAPTLTHNIIGRHQSGLVHTRVCSNKSPWLMHRNVGDVALIPISHGEGRFVCDKAHLSALIENGQVATQYCDAFGSVSMSTAVNPNGSVMAIEGITSPDGRVYGKMAHSERYGKFLYKNVPGNNDSAIFRGMVDYFRL